MQSFQVAIGLDWADEKHAVCLIDRKKDAKEFCCLDQTPEAISDWANSLRRRFPDTQIAICLEQSRGALIYALMKFEFFTLVPVNPKQLARFREALGPSGAKDDPEDAELLAELFVKHGSLAERGWNDQQNAPFPFRPSLSEYDARLDSLPEANFVSEDYSLGLRHAWCGRCRDA